MALADRQEQLRRIGNLRDGRCLISFFNFDRESTGEVPGLRTQFSSDAKEALFRVLKESNAAERGVDLCLYTRGGDTNAVWPIVSIIREFDPDFEVLVPFRAHSAGTLLAMAARRIVLAPLSELSPIDPTTGNQFNPPNPSNKSQRLGISVEDVSGFFHFVRHYLALPESKEGEEFSTEQRAVVSPTVNGLMNQVHPLALGNVWRVHQQIKQLARQLLECHQREGQGDLDTIVEAFGSRFYSHLHMISRTEAREHLGDDHVAFASEELGTELDVLLRLYEDDFRLRDRFVLGRLLGDNLEAEVRFVGGAVESVERGYLYVTTGLVSQRSAIPSNVQVQVPPGQRLPLVPGLPRTYQVDVRSQGWIHNTGPQGVTL